MRTPSWKLASAVAMVLLGTFGSGCAIHTQGPIKEVAYDFSDADFYDRDYAPSPEYDDAYVEYDADANYKGAAFVADRNAAGELVLMPAPQNGSTVAGLVRQPVSR